MLCDQKEVNVNRVKNGEISFSFRRWLPIELKNIWDKIWALAMSYRLTENKDKILWKWDTKGKFTVKSVYNALTEGESGSYLKQIWRGKIPPKIKFFMWLMSNGAVLTKDNMLRRNWVGDPECYFCDNNESIEHLFFK
jgi:anaerobic selenocysteine-containing dehydrogenase